MEQREMTDQKVKMSAEKLTYEAPKVHTQGVDLEYSIASTSGGPQSTWDNWGESQDVTW